MDTNFILLKLNIFHFIKINNLENTYFDKTCFLVDEYGWSIINYANLDSNELDNYNFDNNIQGWYVSQILRNIKTKNKINFDSCIFSKISGLENCDLSNIIFTKCTFNHTYLKNCNCSNTIFDSSVFISTDISDNNNFENTQWNNCSYYF